MSLAPRVAVSLYVALAVHALLLLGLALGPPSQDSIGSSLGLSVPGAGLDTAERRIATAPAPSAADESPIESGANAPSDELPTVRVEAEGREAPVRPPQSASSRRNESRRLAGPATSIEPGPDAGQARQRAGQAGGGGANTYYARLRAHLVRFRHELPVGLPSATARVRFEVSPEGWISGLELVESSGLAALDAEAMDLLRRAAPLPPPPQGRAARLIVPVSVAGPR